MTRRPTPIPRLQPISFFSIGSSGSAWALCNSSAIFVCDICFAPKLSRPTAVSHQRKTARKSKARPDHEAEQAHEINGGKLTDALLPELLEIRQNADREEGQDEE